MGITNFLKQKSKSSTDDIQSTAPALYMALAINGIHSSAPESIYSPIENNFLCEAMDQLSRSNDFMRLYRSYIDHTPFEKNIITQASDLNTSEAPIVWISQKTGLPQKAISRQLNKRLFVYNGNGTYNTYGQNRDIAYSMAYYFIGDTPEIHEDAAGYTVEQGVEDLKKAFIAIDYKPDVVKIRMIGQRLFDADIPIKDGNDGMKQAQASLMSRSAPNAVKLSWMWKDIGNWGK